MKYNPSKDKVLKSVIQMDQATAAAERKMNRKTSDASFSDVKELLDMATEQLKIKEEMTQEWFDEREINMRTFVPLFETYGPEYKETEDDTILHHFTMISGTKTESFLDQYREDREELQYALMKELLVEAFRDWNDLQDDKREIASIAEEYTANAAEYSKYVTSEQYDLDQQNKIARLSELISDGNKTDLDIADIRRTKREILVRSQRYTLEYLYERLNDPKLEKKEIRSIVESYFNRDKSGYIMKRFSQKCGQMQLSPQVQTYLMNLEEGFLEPEFHVFNNLYLFFVMRCVAYSDPQNAYEVKQPIRCMLNLVYHKFYADEPREQFLESMRNFLRRFEAYREVFNEKNILHPKHPHRIERDTKMAAMKRMELTTALATEFPEATVDEKMTLAELSNLYKELSEKRDAEKPGGVDPLEYVSVAYREMLHIRGWTDEQIDDYIQKFAETKRNANAIAIGDELEEIVQYAASYCDRMAALTSMQEALTPQTERKVIMLEDEFAMTDEVKEVTSESTSNSTEEKPTAPIGRGNTIPIIFEAVSPEELEAMERSTELADLPKPYVLGVDTGIVEDPE